MNLFGLSKKGSECMPETLSSGFHQRTHTQTQAAHMVCVSHPRKHTVCPFMVQHKGAPPRLNADMCAAMNGLQQGANPASVPRDGACCCRKGLTRRNDKIVGCAIVIFRTVDVARVF
jgi:hypothetical protein